MFFTKEDFKKIEEYLKLNAKRDTDFDLLNLNINGDDSIAFVHEGRNYRMTLLKFASSLGAKGLYLLNGAFVNMSWEDIDDDGVFSLTPYNSLLDAVLNTPLKYRIPGGILAWINLHGVWQLHLFIGLSSDNWGDISLWKNFNDVTTNGIEFTSSISHLEEGQPSVTILECHTNDGSPAISMKLYKNDILIREFTDTNSFTVLETIDSTTDFKAVVQQYSYTYTERIHISMTLTAWIGAAANYMDIVTDENKIQFVDNIVGRYTITFDLTERLFIVVPSNIVLNPVALNGFEVPMMTSSAVINNKNYNVYYSSNEYVADEYTFIINTFEDMQADLIVGLQLNVSNMWEALQEALDGVGVQLSLTDSDFTAGPGEKIVLENKTLTISDGKGHPISFNVVTLRKQLIQLYTVTFNTMGGSSVPSRQVEAGTVINLDLIKPTKSGKLFGGWYNEGFTIAYSGNITVNSNIALYAKWTDGHLYLLSTSIPQETPTFNSTSDSSIELLYLAGWDNWYGLDNQYIILPAVSGKTLASDYIDIISKLDGESILGSFDVIESTIPSIVVIKQMTKWSVDDSDKDATLTFK